MEKILTSIVTPYGEIFSDEIDSVTLPGAEGEFGVFYGHENLLSLLKAGVIEITNNGLRDLVAIDWGYAEITPSKVDIIANGAVAINNRNEGNISDAIKEAKKLLEDASSDKIAISSVVSRIEQTMKGRL